MKKIDIEALNQELAAGCEAKKRCFRIPCAIEVKENYFEDIDIYCDQFPDIEVGPKRRTRLLGRISLDRVWDEYEFNPFNLLEEYTADRMTQYIEALKVIQKFMEEAND